MGASTLSCNVGQPLFIQYECELYLRQPLTPPQSKLIVAHCTSNHRLAIETGQWMIVPILKILDYAT